MDGSEADAVAEANVELRAEAALGTEAEPGAEPEAEVEATHLQQLIKGKTNGIDDGVELEVMWVKAGA